MLNNTDVRHGHYPEAHSRQNILDDQNPEVRFGLANTNKVRLHKEYVKAASQYLSYDDLRNWRFEHVIIH
jgi:hypothetical protein